MTTANKIPVERIEELESDRAALAGDVAVAEQALADYRERDPKDRAGRRSDLEDDLYGARRWLAKWDKSAEAAELKRLKAEV